MIKFHGNRKINSSIEEKMANNSSEEKDAHKCSICDGNYSTKSKSMSWSKVVFAYILDLIRVNSQTIYIVKRYW